MYIRPQLRRKRSESREILSQEHASDVASYNKTLKEGDYFKRDYNRILDSIERLFGNEEISENDKKSILECLSSILDEHKKEYEHDIHNTLDDIEFSIKNRIDEMENATKQRWYEVYETDRAMWKTEFINKDSLVTTTLEIFRLYSALYENAKSDLRILVKDAAEQRNKIMERRGKNGREYR